MWERDFGWILQVNTKMLTFCMLLQIVAERFRKKTMNGPKGKWA